MENKDIKEVVEDLEKSGKIVEKYEKNSKPYRKSCSNTVKQIVCQKCGSPYSLMKVDGLDGQEYWFCRSCVVKRAVEIAKEREQERRM